MIDVLVVAEEHSAREFILEALEPASYSVWELSVDEISDDFDLTRTPSVIVSSVADNSADAVAGLRRLSGVSPTNQIPLVVVTDSENATRQCREAKIPVAGFVDRGSAPAGLRAAVEASLVKIGEATAIEQAGRVSDILATILEHHSAGVLLFDAHDRLIACNAKAYNLYWPIAKQLRVGLHYSEFLEAVRESAIIDLRGRTPDSWRKARLDGYAKRSISYDEFLNDGRTLLVTQHRTDNAGVCILNFDITHVTARQQGSRGREKRFKRLVEIGMALSSEKNYDHLLESILLEAKSICNADGGTIYLHETVKAADGDTESPFHEHLRFAIVINDTLDIELGGTTGEEIPFPPLPLRDERTGEPNHSNVATHVALTGKSVNIADAYDVEGFDFSGTKAFDTKSGYRSTSFLTIPMKNRAEKVIGVLQLINARDYNGWNVVTFDPGRQQLIEALASQAAVALDNKKLLDEQKNLLDSFIKLIADAIDRKSPYTGGHCTRVPLIAEMLANAACAAIEGRSRISISTTKSSMSSTSRRGCTTAARSRRRNTASTKRGSWKPSMIVSRR